MIFNEIKCHVNTTLGRVGDASPASPPVSAPDECLSSCLSSGNVVTLIPRSLEEYQMHWVQRFNIQGKIYTYVNYSLQYVSEPMRQASMSLSMTSLWNHRFDYVASATLYSAPSSMQRSYFSVREHVVQASRLQQQLRLSLQDEDNPSLNTSFNVCEFPHHHTEN